MGDPLQNISFAQRVELARQKLMQTRGGQGNPNIPEQNLMPHGFKGMGLPIGTLSQGGPHEVPAEVDAALMHEATKEGLTGMTRLPEAAQIAPATDIEEQLGIRATIAPGQSPYLPLQTRIPDVGFGDRFKAMNFSMSPEGMAEYFRGKGYEAQVMPHDIYEERHQPLMQEITSGEGYNIAIKSKETGNWHVLDPQGFEFEDLTDIAADAAITVASVGGANAAQATARGALAATARTTAREASEAAVKGVAPRALASKAQQAGLEAAMPRSFLKERMMGAVKGTWPELPRQALSVPLGLPEEGLGERLMRGGSEVAASALGELIDPFEGIKALIGVKGKGQIKAWLAAKKSGASEAELSQMPLPGGAKGMGDAENWKTGKFETPETDDEALTRLAQEGGDDLGGDEAGGAPLKTEPAGPQGGGGAARAADDTEGHQRLTMDLAGERAAGEPLYSPLDLRHSDNPNETSYRGESTRGGPLLPPRAEEAWNLEFKTKVGRDLLPEEAEILDLTARRVYGGQIDREITPYKLTEPGTTQDEVHANLRSITAKFNDAEGRPDWSEKTSLGQLAAKLEADEGLSSEIRPGREALVSKLQSVGENRQYYIDTIAYPKGTEDIADVIHLRDSMERAASKVLVGVDPYFVNRKHIADVLDGEQGEGARKALSEFDWRDTLNEVDNWDPKNVGLADEVDALRANKEAWGALPGDFDGEKAIRWLAAQPEDKAIAPDKGFKSAFAKAYENGKFLAWVKKSESGLSGAKGVRNTWAALSMDGVRGVGTFGETGIQKAGPTDPLEQLQMLQARKANIPEISEEMGDVEAQTVGRRIIQDKGKLDSIKRSKAQKSRLQELEAGVERAPAAEPAKQDTGIDINRGQGGLTANTAAEREAAAGTINNQTKLKEIITATGNRKQNIITRAINYGYSHARTIESQEKQLGGQVLLTKRQAKGFSQQVEARLKKPDPHTKESLISEDETIRSYVPDGDLPNFEKALEMLGGEHNPLFDTIKFKKSISKIVAELEDTEYDFPAQRGIWRTTGVEAVAEVMETGKVPADWDFSTWNPKIWPEADKDFLYDQVTRVIFEKLETGKYDLDAILGKTTTSKSRQAEHRGDNFARLRAHMEDIAIAHRTTDQALIVGLVAKMNEDFFDVNYKPGRFAEGVPGTGLFDEKIPGTKSYAEGGSKPAIKDELRTSKDTGGRDKEEWVRIKNSKEVDEESDQPEGLFPWINQTDAETGQPLHTVIDFKTRTQVTNQGLERAMWELGRNNVTWGEGLGREAIVYMVRHGTGPEGWMESRSWRWYHKGEGGKWTQVEGTEDWIDKGAVKTAEMNRIIHADALEKISLDEMREAWNNLPGRMAELDQDLDVETIKNAPELLNRLKWLEYTDEQVAEFTPEDAWIRANYGVEPESPRDIELLGGPKAPEAPSEVPSAAAAAEEVEVTIDKDGGVTETPEKPPGEEPPPAGAAVTADEPPESPAPAAAAAAEPAAEKPYKATFKDYSERQLDDFISDKRKELLEHEAGTDEYKRIEEQIGEANKALEELKPAAPAPTAAVDEFVQLEQDTKAGRDIGLQALTDTPADKITSDQVEDYWQSALVRILTEYKWSPKEAGRDPDRVVKAVVRALKAMKKAEVSKDLAKDTFWLAHSGKSGKPARFSYNKWIEGGKDFKRVTLTKGDTERTKGFWTDEIDKIWDEPKGDPGGGGPGSGLTGKKLQQFNDAPDPADPAAWEAYIDRPDIPDDVKKEIIRRAVPSLRGPEKVHAQHVLSNIVLKEEIVEMEKRTGGSGVETIKTAIRRRHIDKDEKRGWSLLQRLRRRLVDAVKFKRAKTGVSGAVLLVIPDKPGEDFPHEYVQRLLLQSSPESQIAYTHGETVSGRWGEIAAHLHPDDAKVTKLRPDDVIYEINDTPSAEIDFETTYLQGKEMTVGIVRDGQKAHVTFTPKPQEGVKKKSEEARIVHRQRVKRSEQFEIAKKKIKQGKPFKFLTVRGAVPDGELRAASLIETVVMDIKESGGRWGSPDNWKNLNANLRDPFDFDPDTGVSYHPAGKEVKQLTMGPGTGSKKNYYVVLDDIPIRPKNAPEYGKQGTGVMTPRRVNEHGVLVQGEPVTNLKGLTSTELLEMVDAPFNHQSMPAQIRMMRGREYEYLFELDAAIRKKYRPGEAPYEPMMALKQDIMGTKKPGDKGYAEANSKLLRETGIGEVFYAVGFRQNEVANLGIESFGKNLVKEGDRYVFTEEAMKSRMARTIQEYLDDRALRPGNEWESQILSGVDGSNIPIFVKPGSNARYADKGIGAIASKLRRLGAKPGSLKGSATASHSFRRSKGSYLVELGAHPSRVSELLGHTDFQTWQRYVAVQTDMLSPQGNFPIGRATPGYTLTDASMYSRVAKEGGEIDGNNVLSYKGNAKLVGSPIARKNGKWTYGTGQTKKIERLRDNAIMELIRTTGLSRVEIFGGVAPDGAKHLPMTMKTFNKMVKTATDGEKHPANVAIKNYVADPDYAAHTGSMFVDESQPIFRSHHQSGKNVIGEPLSPDSASYHIKKWGKAVFGDESTVTGTHTLRHTFNTQMLDQSSQYGEVERFFAGGAEAPATPQAQPAPAAAAPAPAPAPAPAKAQPAPAAKKPRKKSGTTKAWSDHGYMTPKTGAQARKQLLASFEVGHINKAGYDEMIEMVDEFSLASNTKLSAHALKELHETFDVLLNEAHAERQANIKAAKGRKRPIDKKTPIQEQVDAARDEMNLLTEKMEKAHKAWQDESEPTAKQEKRTLYDQLYGRSIGIGEMLEKLEQRLPRKEGDKPGLIDDLLRLSSRETFDETLIVGAISAGIAHALGAGEAVGDALMAAPVLGVWMGGSGKEIAAKAAEGLSDIAKKFGERVSNTGRKIRLAIKNFKARKSSFLKELHIPKGACGHCTQNAALFQQRLAWGLGYDEYWHKELAPQALKDALVIHGTINPPHRPNRFTHAWIEAGDRVIDPTTGNNMSKKEFYKDAKAVREYGFTVNQMMQMTLETENYGPWTHAEIANAMKASSQDIGKPVRFSEMPAGTVALAERPALGRARVFGDDPMPAHVVTSTSVFTGVGTTEGGFTKGLVKPVNAIEREQGLLDLVGERAGVALEAQDIDQADDVIKKIIKAKRKDPNHLFHASPECQRCAKPDIRSSSERKAHPKATLEESDYTNAESLIRIIRGSEPPIVTIENHPSYAPGGKTYLLPNGKEYQPGDELEAALKKLGYTVNVKVFNATDYGAASSRRRMIMRAVKTGDLGTVTDFAGSRPREFDEVYPMPEKTGPSDWYDEISDLIAEEEFITNAKTLKGMKGQMQALNQLIRAGLIEKPTGSRPIFNMGGNWIGKDKITGKITNKGGFKNSMLGGKPTAAPAFTRGQRVARIMFPDGPGKWKVKEVNPDMMKRLMGLGDDFSLPEGMGRKAAADALGNGMHAAATQAGIESILRKRLLPPTQPAGAGMTTRGVLPATLIGYIALELAGAGSGEALQMAMLGSWGSRMGLDALEGALSDAGHKVKHKALGNLAKFVREGEAKNISRSKLLTELEGIGLDPEPTNSMIDQYLRESGDNFAPEAERTIIQGAAKRSQLIEYRGKASRTDWDSMSPTRQWESIQAREEQLAELARELKLTGEFKETTKLRETLVEGFDETHDRILAYRRTNHPDVTSWEASSIKHLNTARIKARKSWNTQRKILADERGYTIPMDDGSYSPQGIGTRDESKWVKHKTVKQATELLKDGLSTEETAIVKDLQDRIVDIRVVKTSFGTKEADARQGIVLPGEPEDVPMRNYEIIYRLKSDAASPDVEKGALAPIWYRIERGGINKYDAGLAAHKKTDRGDFGTYETVKFGDVQLGRTEFDPRKGKMNELVATLHYLGKGKKNGKAMPVVERLDPERYGPGGGVQSGEIRGVDEIELYGLKVGGQWAEPGGMERGYQVHSTGYAGTLRKDVDLVEKRLEERKWGDWQVFEEARSAYDAGEEFFRLRAAISKGDEPKMEARGAMYNPWVWYRATKSAKRRVAAGKRPYPRDRIHARHKPSYVTLNRRLARMRNEAVPEHLQLMDSGDIISEAPWSMTFDDFKNVELRFPNPGEVTIRHGNLIHTMDIPSSTPKKEVRHSVWTKLLDPEYRADHNLSVQVQPISERPIASLSPEEAKGEITRRALARLDRSGRVPPMPDTGRFTGKVGRGVKKGHKTRFTGEALPDLRIRQDALMAIAGGYTDYEGRGLLSSAERALLIEKGSPHWEMLGLDGPVGGFRSVDELVIKQLQADKLIEMKKGKPVLTTGKEGGEKWLKVWHDQQKLHDDFMDEQLKLIDETVDWDMAQEILRDLRKGKYKEGDISAEITAHLQERGIPLRYYTPGHIPEETIAKIQSTPSKGYQVRHPTKPHMVNTGEARITLAMPGKSKEEFRWSHNAATWVTVEKEGSKYARATTVDDLYTQMVAEAAKATEDKAAVIYNYLRAVRQLRDDPKIAPLIPHHERPWPRLGQQRMAEAAKTLSDKASVLENNFMVITKYEDGYHEFRVFNSYEAADDYRNDPSNYPLTKAHGEGDDITYFGVADKPEWFSERNVGRRNLVNVIERGTPGGTLAQFKEAAGVMTRGMEELGPQRGAQMGIIGKLNVSLYRLTQMNEAYTKLSGMLATKRKPKTGYWVPSWRASDLGTETPLGGKKARKPVPAVTKVGGQKGQLSGWPVKWDATGTGWRQVETRAAAIEAYDKLVLKFLPKEVKIYQGLLDQKTGFTAPVTRPENKFLLGSDREQLKRAKKRAGGKRRATSVIKKGLGVVVGSGLVYLAAKAGIDAVDVVDVAKHTAPTLMGMIGLGTGLKESIKEAKGVPNLWSETAERILAFIPEQATKLKHLGIHAWETARRKATVPLSKQRIGMDRSDAIGRVGGGRFLADISESLGPTGHRSLNAEGKPGIFTLGAAGGPQGRITDMYATLDNLIDTSKKKTGRATKDSALSGHDGNPGIKTVIASTDEAGRTTRDGAPYNANINELNEFKETIIEAARSRGYHITEAKWKGEKVPETEGGSDLDTFYDAREKATYVVHRGFFISKEGMWTEPELKEALGRKHTAEKRLEWDQESAVYRVEAEDILERMDKKGRDTFIRWLADENAGQTYIRGPHEGGLMRKFGKKLYDLVKKYAKGEDIPWGSGKGYKGGKVLNMPEGSGVTGRLSSSAEMAERAGKETPEVEYIKLTDEAMETIENLTSDDIKRLRTVQRDIATPGRGLGEDEGASPAMGKAAKDILSMPNEVRTEAAKDLVTATKRLQDPISTMSGSDRQAQETSFLLNYPDEKGRAKLRRTLLKDVQVALKEFLVTPEGHPLRQALERAGKALKTKAGGKVGTGVRYWYYWRMLRSWLPGGGLGGGLVRNFWRFRRAKWGMRIVGNIAEDLAREPTRAQARKLFLAHPKAMKELPDSILRQLGLPPFEAEYKERHRGAMLSRKVLNWMTSETGVEFPATGAGAGSKETDDVVGGILGRLSGSGGGEPVFRRLGLQRLRDRPIIKEELERSRRTMGEDEEEKKKKKRGRVLRLPKKLQRSS